MKIHCLILALAVGSAFAGETLNFLTMGDWGGADSSPFTTPAEVGCAKGMGKIAAELEAEFVVGLGDNFYNSGIHHHATDPRFNETFESVFTAPSLQIPFYFIAGNHDYANADNGVEAEIAYTNISKRWNFPDYYYSQTFTFGANLTFKLILVDTVKLTGLESDLEFGVFDEYDTEVAESQWSWIESELVSAANATYVWVGGHYPVWSVCQHGPNFELKSRLRPLLEKYHAHYMCGHDHCLEHIDDGSGVIYSLSGAAHECCYSDKNKDKIPAGSLKYSMDGSNRPAGVLGGFASFRVNKDNMTIVYHSDNGNVLYTADPIAPRKLE